MSTTNEYKIAIVGPSDTVSGFKALGVEAFSAQTAEEAIQQLKEIKQQTLDPDSLTKYAVVCVIEDLVALVDQANLDVGVRLHEFAGETRQRHVSGGLCGIQIRTDDR